MKQMSGILKNLTLLGQLGLSFVTPILLCLFLCMFLEHRFGAPLWIYIPGFIFGLGGSFMSVWKFYQATQDQERKEDAAGNSSKETAERRRKKGGGLFNQHW